MGASVNQKELADLFRKLGAPHAETWAKSQIQEGIPQLARFLFLRQAWRKVASEEDTSWIGRWIERYESHPTEPFAGQGRALKQLRARGATDEEITDLVRAREAELLFSFCYLLEDPEINDSGADDVTWGLFQTDDDGNPLVPLMRIGGLHESVLETDPTGREMRPRTTQIE
jgi:hypothetical protein